MTGLQRFEFGALDIRVELDDGQPWFVLADVCQALGLVKPDRVAARLEDDEKGARPMSTPGGTQMMTVVSEPGLYRVIFRSNKPEAARFQRWVFHEVLPAIRQTGSFHAREEDLQELPEVDQPLLERIVRYPDGREVIERFAEPGGGRSGRAVASLPEPPPVQVDVPLELLRKRFHGALSTALEDLPEYRRLRCSQRRGEFFHRLNSALKAFVGRERSRWSTLDYHNGVHWLLMQYGVDIRWILEWGHPSFVTHRLGGER